MALMDYSDTIGGSSLRSGNRRREKGDLPGRIPSSAPGLRKLTLGKSIPGIGFGTAVGAIAGLAGIPGAGTVGYLIDRELDKANPYSNTKKDAWLSEGRGSLGNVNTQGQGIQRRGGFFATLAGTARAAPALPGYRRDNEPSRNNGGLGGGAPSGGGSRRMDPGRDPSGGKRGSRR